MHEIEKTLKIENWEDWINFLNCLIELGIISMKELDKHDFIKLPNKWQYSKVEEVILNKKGLGFGIFYFYYSETSSFKATYSMGHEVYGDGKTLVIRLIPDSIKTVSEWISSIKQGQ